jgi:hypothetical protein
MPAQRGHQSQVLGPELSATVQNEKKLKLPVRGTELTAPDTAFMSAQRGHQPEVLGPELGRLVLAARCDQLVARCDITAVDL